MQGGVASVIRLSKWFTRFVYYNCLEKSKPNEDVRNLFDRRTYHKDEDGDDKDGSHSPNLNSQRN